MDLLIKIILYLLVKAHDEKGIVLGLLFFVFLARFISSLNSLIMLLIEL